MSKYIPGNQKHLTLEGHIYIETSLNKGLAFKDIVRSLGGNDFATPLPARKRTDFNPRSHEGNDIFEVGWIEDHKYFNPRSHEGNDIFEVGWIEDHKYFNPRSHEGNDNISVLLLF